MSHKSTQNATIKHVQNVQVKIASCITALQDRAMKHDRSKFDSPEKEIFDKYTPKLKMSTYGSKGYDNTLKKMRPALDHHYSNNRHHPEYFIKYVCNHCLTEYKGKHPESCDICGAGYLFTKEIDINQMNLIDLMEMFCDWIAATERHADGDIFASLEVNKTRFKINDQLIDIFKNTALDLFNKAPVKSTNMVVRPEDVKNDK